MNIEIVNIIASIVTATTPLLLAATGELITEKSGVLNLGLEGMMLVGAVVAFATVSNTGSHTIAIAAAVVATIAMSLIFAVLVMSFMANQVATGLALTIFGTGLSALIGTPYVGGRIEPLAKIAIPFISDIPVIGDIFFNQDILSYFSFFAIFACSWFLNKTRWGLILRAVGNSHHAAHAIGYSVVTIRYGAIAFGGAMAGLAGGFISMVYTTSWGENLTSGRGWIALALVVFATWRPYMLLLGAYLFGCIMYLSLYLQSWNIGVPSQALSSLPYIVTIIVLAVISRDKFRVMMRLPACLGQTFLAAK